MFSQNLGQALQDSKRIPRVPATPWAFITYVIRHCSTRMKRLAAVAIAMQTLATVCDVLVVWVMGRIVGVVLTLPPEQLWGGVLYELAIFALLWTVRNAALRTYEYANMLYTPELLNTTRALMFNRLVQQSQNFLHSNFAGSLANHVRRAGDVVGSLQEKFQGNIVPVIIKFIVSGVLLWAISPKLTGFVFVFIVIMIIAGVRLAPRFAALSERHADKVTHLSGYIIDSISSLSTVQQNVGWPEEQKRLDEAHAEMSQTYTAREKFKMLFWGSYDFFMTFFFCGFMALVVYAWQLGNVSTGQLAMTVGLVSALFGSLAHTLWLLGMKFDDIGTLRDALHKISTPLSVLDAPTAPDLQVHKGTVEFRNVDFSYVPGQPVFMGLNITIPAGQKVGVVGVSGAGKTTLCQLLLRAYDVTGGGVFIDGQNIAEVTQDSVHAAIAVIPQDPALFHRSLGDNIRYGRMDASDNDVKAAAVAAEAAHFINVLPQGYDTLVGERGVKLSGGQRQRIAIARAIVKNAPILVLDEATSALDSETEKAIQTAMLHAMEGRTTLVIAHRLSTLSHMDRIIVMERGHVVEDGSFQQLLALNGTFARLWNLQAGGFLPESLPQ